MLDHLRRADNGQGRANFNRVTQIGTQQRSMPINNWASDLVKNGAIGKILAVTAPNFCGPERWTKTSSAGAEKPAAPWWDVWTNQVELRPYGSGHPPRLGPVAGLRHRRPQLRPDRLGRPRLRSDQSRLGTDHTGPVEVILDEPVAMHNAGKLAGTDRRRRPLPRHGRHR